MEYSIKDYEAYLLEHYQDGGIDSSLFMKLVEEIGEVAEVLNRRDGRKANGAADTKAELANELVDVIHYTVAIAALNQIDLSQAILEKDKRASLKYHHTRNFEAFLEQK